MVVQDRHGKGQPVALGFFATEKGENLASFFDAFKRAHARWTLATYFFVDKDYNEVGQLEKAFPDAKILFCLWHVLAYVRKYMTKDFGSTRARAYRHFYDCVYCYSEPQFERNWKDMMDIVRCTLIAQAVAAVLEG